MEEITAAALAKKETWDAWEELNDELYGLSAKWYMIAARIQCLREKLDEKSERLSMLPINSRWRKDRLGKRIKIINKELRSLRKKRSRLDEKLKPLYNKIRKSSAEFQIANNKYENARGDMLSGQ